MIPVRTWTIICLLFGNVIVKTKLALHNRNDATADCDRAVQCVDIHQLYGLDDGTGQGHILCQGLDGFHILFGRDGVGLPALGQQQDLLETTLFAIGKTLDRDGYIMPA
jgi:hypothetical protein